MTKAMHTPGPWEYVEAERLSHDAPEIGPIVSPGGILGGPADDPSWVIEGEIEFAPDARLIAAAPDMLAALKALVRDSLASDFNEHWQSFKDAESAIAKATGVV